MKDQIKRKERLIAITILLFGLALLLQPQMVRAQTGKDPGQTLKAAIEDQLANHHLLKGNAIEVSVANGSITLAGTVATLYQKDQVGREARSVGDDYQLVNNLQVNTVGVNDQELTSRVFKRLHDNIFYSIFDWVNTSVDHGTVTLSGWVDQPWHKKQFEHQVERVPGVAKIDNNIQVESFSPFDDQIRYKAARLIYDDAFYEPYSESLGPSIHIVVNNGQVTLEGSVDSSIRRNWAENELLLNTDAMNVVNDLRVQGT